MKPFKRRLVRVLIVIVVLDLALGFFWWRRSVERRYDAQIIAAANEYGVPPALVKAVVWRESRFRATARGKVGEIGLMQIRSGTAEEWAKAEKRTLMTSLLLYDPAMNTKAGAWYLSKLLRRYPMADNPLPYALADYNAGRANVLRWATGAAFTNSAQFVQQITFPSTRAYVEAVSKKFTEYEKTFPEKK